MIDLSYTENVFLLLSILIVGIVAGTGGYAFGYKKGVDDSVKLYEDL